MPDPEPAAVTRFKEAHSARGGGGRVVILPDTVHTAALAAEALGCEVGAIANSLLFDAGGTPVLILTSGAHRVDTAATAERIGVPALKRATPEFVRAAHRPGDRRRLPDRPPLTRAHLDRRRAPAVRRDLGRRGPPGRRLLHDVRRAAALTGATETEVD